MAILRKIQQQKKEQKKLFRSPFTFDDKEDIKVKKEEFEQKEQAPVPRKKKTKKGRPRIPKEERRTKCLSAVLTPTEAKKLEKLTKKARLSKSEYIRRLILQAIDKQIYHL